MPFSLVAAERISIFIATRTIENRLTGGHLSAVSRITSETPIPPPTLSIPSGRLAGAGGGAQQQT
jgi:hypothetical protein